MFTFAEVIILSLILACNVFFAIEETEIYIKVGVPILIGYVILNIIEYIKDRIKKNEVQ